MIPTLIQWTNHVSDWLLVALVTACVLGHLAVLRAPDYAESPQRESIRRVKIAGLTILAIRWWYVMLATGDLLIPSPTAMGLTLLLGAEAFKTIYQLFSFEIDGYCHRCRCRQKGESL